MALSFVGNFFFAEEMQLPQPATEELHVDVVVFAFLKSQNRSQCTMLLLHLAPDASALVLDRNFNAGFLFLLHLSPPEF